jgi:hypothetical protein
VAVHDVEVELAQTSLQEHRPLGCPEDGVRGRVALRDLGGDFRVKVVGGVLGFPVTAWKVVAVA